MASTKATVTNIFSNTLRPKAVSSFTLMRGVTDYTNLQQFDMYETGYSFLICLKIPKFLEELANKNSTDYKDLIDSYQHIIEYEFRGAQGIEDMTTETQSLTNGISALNVITRVTEQEGSSFTMSYFERSGSIITKTHELFLRGIKDPRTQVKRYCGLLTERIKDTTSSSVSNVTNTNATQTAIQKGSFEYEVFHFLLIITDNTALNVEKAYILASAQPSTAMTGTIYNVTRGDISFSELALNYNAYPISGRIVNEKACTFLDAINEATCFDEMEFGYNILVGDTSALTTGTVGQSNQTYTMTASPTVDNPKPTDVTVNFSTN